jgi:hypothetical protein
MSPLVAAGSKSCRSFNILREGMRVSLEQGTWIGIRLVGRLESIHQVYSSTARLSCRESTVSAKQIAQIMSLLSG